MIRAHSVDDELARRIRISRRRYLILLGLSTVAGAGLGFTWWSYRGLDPQTGAFAGLLVGLVLPSVVLARIGRRDVDRQVVVMLGRPDAEPWASARLEPGSLESVRKAIGEAEDRFAQGRRWEQPLDDAVAALGRTRILRAEGRSRLARSIPLRALLLAGLAAAAVLAPGAQPIGPSRTCPGPELDVAFVYRGVFRFAYGGRTWVDLTGDTRGSSPCVVAAFDRAKPIDGAAPTLPVDDPYLPNVLAWQPAVPPVADGIGPIGSAIFPFGRWAADGPIVRIAGSGPGAHSWYRLADDDALNLIRELFKPVDLP